MTETYPNAPDDNWNNVVLRAMANESANLARFYLKRPRDERELRLQENIAYISTIRNDTWQKTLQLLDGAVTRDVLLEPKLYSPLLVYPSSSLSFEQPMDCEDYFVQPRIVTDLCEDDYDKYRDWLAEDVDNRPDINFIRGIKGLRVAFSFYKQTNRQYDPLLVDENYAGVNESGFMVLRDTRFDTIISFPEEITGTKELAEIADDTSDLYVQRFIELFKYFRGVKRAAHDQAMLVEQLMNQHLVKRPFEDFQPTENEPDFIFPNI